jgi:ATP-binding cassette subfamily F protein 3
MSGRDVLVVRDLAIEGGGRQLFAGLGFTVRAGDRLAILGPNGSGKTTLLRVLLGELDATAGTVEWGHGTEAAFLRQDLSDIDNESSVLDNILAQSDMLPGDARTLLASFEFKGEDVFKPAAALSGGERCRLSMASLLISGANVLLLDEPTNHLDIAARGSLEDALAAYAGTVIFVSHDRYFIDRVASSVLAFERTGPAYHRGNFSSYRQARAVGLAPSTTETALPPAVRQQIEALLAERTALEAEMQQASGRSSPRESRRRVQRYREIEIEIGRLQKRAGRGR